MNNRSENRLGSIEDEMLHTLSRLTFLITVFILCLAGISKASSGYSSAFYYNKTGRNIKPVDLLLRNGLSLSANNNYEEAIPSLMAVVSSHSFMSMKYRNKILYILSKDFAGTGDLNSAIFYLIPVINETKDRALLIASILKGINYFSDRRDVKLASAISYGIKKTENTTDDKLNFSYGWFFSIAGYPISARTFFKRVKNNYELAIQAGYLIGVSLLKQGKINSAKAVFARLINNKTLKKDGKIYVLAKLSLARMLYDSGDFYGALNLYKQIPRKSSYYIQALYEFFWAAQKANEFDKALKLGNRLLAVKQPALLKLKVKIQKGYLLAKLKRYDAATNYFSDTIRQYDQAIDIIKTTPAPLQLANSSNRVEREVGSSILRNGVYRRMRHVNKQAFKLYTHLKIMKSYLIHSGNLLEQSIFVNERLLRGFDTGISDLKDSSLRIILSRNFDSAKYKISILNAFKQASLARELIMRYFMTLYFTKFSDINVPEWRIRHGKPFYIYNAYKNVLGMEKQLNSLRVLSLDIQLNMAKNDGLIDARSRPALNNISNSGVVLADIKTTLNSLIKKKYTDAMDEVGNIDMSYNITGNSWLRYANGKVLKDMYADINGSLNILASQAEVAFIDTRILSKEVYTKRINREYSESEKEVKGIVKKYRRIKQGEKNIVGTIPTSTTIEIKRGNGKQLIGYLKKLQERLRKLRAMKERE